MRTRSLISSVVLAAIASSAWSCGKAKPKEEPRSYDEERAIEADWVRVEPGEYTVGAPESDPASRDNPQKTVKIEKGFLIDKYEVTNYQYRKFLDTLTSPDEKAKFTPKPDPITRRGWKKGWYPKGQTNFPVTGVDYHAAEAYAKWRGGRLPTEFEWEVAARGTDKRRFPWGNEWNSSAAWVGQINQLPKAVGSFEAGRSPCGALDLCGNVWEWTSSWFDERVKNINPKVRLCGGSFNSEPADTKATMRKFMFKNEFSEDIGFRCVKDA